MNQINTERLKEIEAKPIQNGSHPTGIQNGMCVMEAVSYVAGEPWSDTPECASPVIGAFLRSWNDSISDDELRTRLLRPLVAKLVGTKASAEVEHRRSLMAADWLVRVNTPAWLRLAGLTVQADALAGLPEITAMAQVPGIKPAIEAARKDASAAGDAAWAAARAAAWAAARAAAWDAAWAAAGDAAGDAARDAAWAAAGDAAWAAAGDAAWAAARAAAWDAAWAAAGDAAWDAARAAARAAAWAAAWDAAWAAARQKFAPTVTELQGTVIALVERMIACGKD